jgi:hypothetical protein
MRRRLRAKSATILVVSTKDMPISAIPPFEMVKSEAGEIAWDCFMSAQSGVPAVESAFPAFYLSASKAGRSQLVL